MSAEPNPVARPRPAILSPGRAFPLAALVLLALALGGLSARGAGAQEVELQGVPADSVGEDFLQPGAPAAPAAPGDPAGPRTIEGPGGIYRVHAGKNDVVQMGEDILIESGEHVLGHVFAMGGTITVRGIVDDDVVAIGGDVVLEPGAQVRGDAVSIGGQVRKDPGATILGSSVSVGNVPGGFMGLQVLNFIGRGVDAVSRIFGILFTMLLAWALVSLTRARTERIAARIEQAPLATLGWGALAFIGVAPATIAVALAAVLLVVTIIGIPVAVLGLLGYSFGVLLLVIWGALVGAVVVGAWLVRRLSPRLGAPSLVRHAMVGVVALAALELAGDLFGAVGMVVPPAGILSGLLGVLGWIVCIATTLAGVGAILMTRAGQPAPLPPHPGGPI